MNAAARLELVAGRARAVGGRFRPVRRDITRYAPTTTTGTKS